MDIIKFIKVNTRYLIYSELKKERFVASAKITANAHNFGIIEKEEKKA